MTEYRIDWQSAKDPTGSDTTEFIIDRGEKSKVTGAIWLPNERDQADTLMLFGHGASGNRYQAPISHLANRFVKEARTPVLSIDGPVHGLRQVGPGGREAFAPVLRRKSCLDDMLEDWHLAIDVVRALDRIPQQRLAYFGLSMGSIFGIPLVASRADVTVATLGLVGTGEWYPHRDQTLAACKAIECPLLFLMQLEDEIFSRQGYLEIFDAFSSQDKRIHANPGLHAEIPQAEIRFSFDFMLSHMQGTAERRMVKPLAE